MMQLLLFGCLAVAQDSKPKTEQQKLEETVKVLEAARVKTQEEETKRLDVPPFEKETCDTAEESEEK